MKIFKDKHALQKEILGNTGISFIPTMGGLHKGHVYLIKRARRFRLKTLVSIYINPKQFDKKKDFKSYPRNQKKDIKILKKLRVDYLYIPTFKDIYGFKTKKNFFLDKFSKKLCGKKRPGHFKGVLNVVNRFFEIIKPKYIFMGKKDYQQLYLIKKHIKKMKIKTRMIECKTIREKKGIACSSRNFSLSKNQLMIACDIYKYLVSIKKKIKNNFRLFNSKEVKNKVFSLGANKIDYVENYNIDNFKKAKKGNENFNIFIAYYIGNVRLIDNI